MENFLEDRGFGPCFAHPVVLPALSAKTVYHMGLLFDALPGHSPRLPDENLGA
jgi:hypothetical protein